MKIGVHELELEPPDLAFMRTRGTATDEDARAMADALVGFAGERKFFVLSHLEVPREANMSASARKIFIDRTRGLNFVAIASVGGSFQARILTRLVEAAWRVLSRTSTRMRFFDDEPSARAWLREQGCVACGATSGPDRSSGSS